MTLEETSPGVFYTNGDTLRVTRTDLDFLVASAQSTPRLRSRLCAHRNIDSSVHEMLICLDAATYVHPHRHFKSESIHIIEGRCDIVLFDEAGVITDVLDMQPSTEPRLFFCRLPQRTYHTLLVRSPYLLFHETTQGPFRREDTEFAPWAPEETDSYAIDAYKIQLQRQIDAREDSESHG